MWSADDVDRPRVVLTEPPVPLGRYVRGMRGVRAGLSAVLATLSCLALAPTANALPAPETVVTDLSAFEGQQLAWRACSAESQCADLTVPLDYANPSGPTITIAVRRTPATGERKGSLLANPGGPGVPGMSYASMLGWTLPDGVAASYDLIGFDPRGVGQSSPMRCLTQRELKPWFTADATPDTAAEQRAFARLAHEFGVACTKRSPELVAHVSTRDAARDLDILRAVLGDEQLTFVGASYGTYLGLMYADQFPQRVGRLVLDGVVDPRDDQVSLTDGQIDGFDDAATRLARHCARDRACAVPGRTTSAVLREINGLFAALDRAPIKAGSGAPLMQQEAITGLLAGLYDKGSWDGTLDAIGAAIDGDGRELASMGRSFLTSSATFLSAFYAVSCIDSPPPPGSRAIATWATQRAGNVNVPELARYLAWSVLPCTTWPAHVPEPPGPVHAENAAPILAIGTTHDPATPYAWARSVARQLDSGVLLTRAGDGHTAIGTGSHCISDAVGDYLVRGVVPDHGTVCR